MTKRVFLITFSPNINLKRKFCSMSKSTEKKFGRRSFLASTAASMLGYSVIVKAPQVLARELPSDENSARLKKIQAPKDAKNLAGEFFMKRSDIKCDLLVAGGGLAGISAALSAARKGKKVVLVQDRSRLGGNSSSEIRMHPLGVNPERVGWREGGIIEELKLENAAHNPQLAWEMWDFILYDKCVSEPNLTLILDATLFKTETDGDKITAAWVRSDTTLQGYRIEADLYVDATGDCRLGMESGAEIMTGRDGVDAYGESLADFDEVGTRQGSTLMITSRLHDKPMPFVPPSWAKKITPEQMKFRSIKGDGLSYGYWWIELGGVYDAIRDNEMLRFELLSIVMGVWDYIKNSGKYEGVENRALETIGMVPGRRDTNRIRGEHLMTQHDIEGKWKDFDDSVAVGGWSMDDHPAKGFYASDRHPCRQKGHVPCYNIPFSSLYSNKVKNLMMAGRNISCSHVAFSSTRVMSTCAAVGQAVGTAAAICLDDKITPAQLRANPEKVKQLQQTLLRDDQTILGIKNTDPADLARSAKVTASESIADSAPENVISGITIDLPKQNKNRWVASAASKPWIKLEWSSPQKFSQVRFIFEPGNTALSQTGSDYLLKTMIRGPQPKIVREYQVTAVLEDGSEKVLADVKNNYQKLVVNKFDPVLAKALKVQVSATNGDPNVIIKEIRVEA